MRTLLLTTVVASLSLAASAQVYDAPMTMYHQQLMQVNPANAGTGTYKWNLNSVYRETGYIVSRPYRTFNGGFDINLPFNIWSGNIFGFGFNVNNDDQGDYYLLNRRYSLNLAVGQYLDPRQEHSLCVGFNLGAGQRSIDYTDAYWNVQWRGDGFNKDVDPKEPLLGNVRSYFDLGTGLKYSYTGPDMIDFEGGLAVYHLNRPDVSFYRDADSSDMDPRVVLHADFTHRIRDNSHFALRPSALVQRQNQRTVIQGGSYYQFIFHYGTQTTGKRSETSMSLGTFVRYAQGFGNSHTADVLGTFNFDFGGFTFGAGYDVPLGSFNTINGFEGGFEFMLGYKSGFRRGLYNTYTAKKKGKL